MVAELNNSPIKFLSANTPALRTVRKEIITLALVKLAVSDSEGAAFQLDSKWELQPTAEERNWLWGLIGK